MVIWQWIQLTIEGGGGCYFTTVGFNFVVVIDVFMHMTVCISEKTNGQFYFF